MTIRTLYLVLAIVGYLATNSLVLLEGIENHNILLWTKPTETSAGLFANRISTIFGIDLFFVVFIFFVWTFREAKRLGMKGAWKYWVLTMVFGLAGTFPLFLWARDKYLKPNN